MDQLFTAKIIGAMGRSEDVGFFITGLLALADQLVIGGLSLWPNHDFVQVHM